MLPNGLIKFSEANTQKGSNLFPYNYRGIAIESRISKLVSLILPNYVKDHCPQFENLICFWQGKRTSNHIHIYYNINS